MVEMSDPRTFHARSIGILTIAVTSFGGVLFPILATKRWGDSALHSSFFTILRCFATGVICGVALAHVLPDANEYLQNVTDYPLANVIAMLGAFLMILLEQVGMIFMARLSQVVAQPALDTTCSSLDSHAHSLLALDGHTHSQPLLLPGVTDLPLSTKVMAYAMEAAIAIHSVLIGMGLGVINNSFARAVTLALALCFHQLFEGMALGMSAIRADLDRRALLSLITIFSTSCPLGGCFGLLVSESLDFEDERTSLILGTMNALAAGTLLQIGFMNLLNEDFSAHSAKKQSISLVCYKLLALLAGAGAMCVLAIWA